MNLAMTSLIALKKTFKACTHPVCFPVHPGKTESPVKYRQLPLKGTVRATVSWGEKMHCTTHA